MTVDSASTRNPDASPITMKRTAYLDWSEYFMATAFLAAQRSKDPSTQVGAVIVNDDRKVVGIGYNGFPRGCSDDTFPWNKSDPDPTLQKFMYVVHAEVNAILNKNSADVKGCTMYVALFPCNECAKMIIQSGVRKVVYMSDKHAHKPQTVAAKRMFDATGLCYVQYKPGKRQITINFCEDILTDQVADMRLTESSSDSPNQTSQPNDTKRTNYLGWSEYFMATALLAAQRSKDPSTQVGACIVNEENQIVGIGYNGLPTGCSDDIFPWNRDNCPTDPLRNKYLFVCHAEVNAISNKNSVDVKGCTIYVALFPCNECAKVIIQSGIRKVVYLSDKYATTTSTLASKQMFDTVGVTYEVFRPSRPLVVIDFDDIERKNLNQLPATP